VPAFPFARFKRALMLFRHLEPPTQGTPLFRFSVQGAHFYYPALLNRRADGSRLFVALPMDWFKYDWKEDREARRLTKSLVGRDGNITAGSVGPLGTKN
jgi:hypothetical protein